mgnify:CR=1 FL=1
MHFSVWPAKFLMPAFTDDGPMIIDNDGIRSIRPFTKKPQRFCIFEYVYFARPDSQVENRNVYEVRKRIGAELAKVARDPAIVKKMEGEGYTMVGGTPEQMRAYIAVESARWAKVVWETGIKLEE